MVKLRRLLRCIKLLFAIPHRSCLEKSVTGHFAVVTAVKKGNFSPSHGSVFLLRGDCSCWKISKFQVLQLFIQISNFLKGMTNSVEKFFNVAPKSSDDVESWKILNLSGHEKRLRAVFFFSNVKCWP